MLVHIHLKKEEIQMNQCPICYDELEVRDCPPCHDCGWREIEIDHFKRGSHTFAIYEIYKGIKLTLCDFCCVDFGSYNSNYLGFIDNRRISFKHFNFVRNQSIERDKFCNNCGHRLKFLSFLRDIREKTKNSQKN